MKTFLYIYLCSMFTVSLADELTIRKEIASKVNDLFMNEKYDELESLSQKYRSTGERTSSGLWKLTLFYSGFSKLTENQQRDERYWKLYKNNLEKWIYQFPKSPSAHIVKGIIINNYAWNFRGNGWAKDVSEEAWKPFKDNLKIARDHMYESKDIAAVDSHWYEVTVHILKGLNENEAVFMNLVNEGLDKSPNYYQLYFAAIDFLAPKWHGDKRKIEEFANKAVARTKSSEGMGMYARIYWYASQTQYGEKLFMDSDVVWNKMKLGMNDVLSKYDDQWNIQNFAFFACFAKDKEQTKLLFDKINGPIYLKAWKNKEYYESCRSYAYGIKSP